MLEYVSLNNCFQIVDETIDILAKVSSGIRSLNISGCPKLKGNFVLRLTNLKRLRTLLMAECDSLIAVSLHNFAQSCPLTLEVIDLSSTNGVVSRVTDDVIVLLSLRLGPNLTKLSLNNCLALTDRSMFELGKNCPNLTHLYLALSAENPDDQYSISDRGIGALAKNGKLLVLDISYRTRITERTLSSLFRCTELKTLTIEGCKKITTAQREKFSAQFPSVIILPFGA